MRQRLGAALDLLVEFSTLGEYRLPAHVAGGLAGAPPAASDRDPRLGGAGDLAARAADRTGAVEGAAVPERGPRTGSVLAGAAATPAARPVSPARCAGPAQPRAATAAALRRGDQPSARHARPARRGGASVPPEQPCLAR
jgi:hypothetical protein